MLRVWRWLEMGTCPLVRWWLEVSTLVRQRQLPEMSSFPSLQRRSDGRADQQHATGWACRPARVTRIAVLAAALVVFSLWTPAAVLTAQAPPAQALSAEALAAQAPPAPVGEGAVFLVGGQRYRVGDGLYTMEVAPFLEEDRVFVPVRYLAYALGVPEEGVRWDARDRAVTLWAGGTRVRVAVGSPLLEVDGRSIKMDVTPRLLPPGRVVLPARFVAEALGYEVAWDASARAVLIGRPGRLPDAAGVPPVLEALVLRAVDGDTLEVEAAGRRERVRLIGLDCPELSHPELGIAAEPYGRLAAAYTAGRLEGRTVWLERDVSDRDGYGRLLRYVWLDRPWEGSEAEAERFLFNAELLREGYARVMTVPPDVRYAGLFVRLAREAREARKGLWSE